MNDRAALTPRDLPSRTFFERSCQWSVTLGHWVGWAIWMIFFRSPATMGWSSRTLLPVRLGLSFFLGLILFAQYEQWLLPNPARTSQILLAQDYLLRRQVAAALRFEWLWRRPNIDAWVQESALLHGVEVDLIHAIILAESNYCATAISPMGACGLMQIMPQTVQHLGGGNPFDPRENIAMGTRYLAELHRRFPQNPTHAIAAYNAGPGAVRRYRDIPPFPETQRYVDRVIGAYNERKHKSQ